MGDKKHLRGNDASKEDVLRVEGREGMLVRMRDAVEWSGVGARVGVSRSGVRKG